METFKVPQREEVSANNQVIFDNLKSQLGFVPNLYAVMAYSDSGLENYLTLQGGKTSLSNKEKELVNLVVSQINECRYCQSAHTVIGKMNGFTEEQILEIRTGRATFNSKLDTLAKLTAEITVNKGQINEDILTDFFDAGYSKATLVDVVIAIADKVVMNYLHNLTQVPIDFQVAPELESIKY